MREFKLTLAIKDYNTRHPLNSLVEKL